MGYSVADPETSEREGATKHKIEADSLDGHRFYDYFYSLGGHHGHLAPLDPLLRTFDSTSSALVNSDVIIF